MTAKESLGLQTPPEQSPDGHWPAELQVHWPAEHALDRHSPFSTHPVKTDVVESGRDWQLGSRPYVPPVQSCVSQSARHSFGWPSSDSVPKSKQKSSLAPPTDR